MIVFGSKRFFLDRPIGFCSKIGVLGGIGPEATGVFYDKLIGQLQKTGLIKRNTDYPQIIINSIPAPELIYEDISESQLSHYAEGLKELEKLNVDFILMVCNTIHLYHDALQEKIKTPLIDLRKEVKDFLESKGIKKSFIIGTPNTIRKGLYRFEGIDCLEPDEDEIKILSESIFNFNRGLNKEMQVKKVKSICEKYICKGAEIVILGCTEFAVMLDKENIPKLNTIDVLVKAVIDYLLSATAS